MRVSSPALYTYAPEPRGGSSGSLLDHRKREACLPPGVGGRQGERHPVGSLGRSGGDIGQQRAEGRRAFGGRKRGGDIRRRHRRPVGKVRVGANGDDWAKGLALIDRRRQVQPDGIIAANRGQPFVQQGGEVEIGAALGLIRMQGVLLAETQGEGRQRRAAPKQEGSLAADGSGSGG